MKVLFWLFIGLDQHATSEHLLSAILEQLCKAGNEVHIIQKGTGGNLPPIPEALANYTVTTDVIPLRDVDKGNFAARYMAELKYINDCKKYITSEYDAVFIQSTTVGGFAVKAIRKRLPKAIVTFNVQDIFPYNAVFSGSVKKNGVVFKVLAAIQRYAYRHVDHIITISEDMKDTLVKAGAPANQIDVIYNWSYQDHLYEDLDLSAIAHMFPAEYFNVVYAGNIGVMQNVDILIEAAKLMKNDESVWFHIIGNGVYKDKLMERADDYKVSNISFWPMQPPEMAPLIYSTAGVNIIPLVKNVYKTALPSKTATCLACRKPIIFAIGKKSKFGQRMMKEADCPVVESNRPDELAKTIQDIRAKEKSDMAGNFFLKHCQKTQNSRKYAEIITSSRNH